MVRHTARRPAVLLAALCLSACFDTTEQPDGQDPSTADGGDDHTSDAGALVRCGVVGRSVACVGPGGCSGGQVCQRDGSFGTCDCGAAPTDPNSENDGAAMTIPDADAPACGVGTPCMRDGDCATGFFCIAELSAYIPATDVPGGGDRVPITFFPGGVCSPGPLRAWDNPLACDMFADDGLQGCGDCGRCGGIQFDSGLVVGCLESCTPSQTSSGCSRDGYSCDVNTRTCMQGCTSDVECKLAKIDSDGDGLSETSIYDPDSQGVCDPATLRCSRPGAPGATAGDPCSRDDDCEADGHCLGPDKAFAGNPFVDGYCSKSGCKNEGLECAGEGVCTQLRTWDPFPTLGFACHKGCTQGAEAESLKLGPGGHGDECREGQMCVWAGVANDRSGFCVSGNYNDVTSSNLGAPCSASSECYSPQGHGSCLLVADGVSICTVMDCDTPGLPAAVCGEEGACLLLADERRTACVLRCTDASDCPAGLGCAPAGGAIPTDIIGVCLSCSSDAQCIAGQTCDQGVCS